MLNGNPIPTGRKKAKLVKIPCCRVIAGGHGAVELPKFRGVGLAAIVRANFICGWYEYVGNPRAAGAYPALRALREITFWGF